MHYLYLLKFKDNEYFKIGISSNNFNRVLNHNNTYGIDLDSSLIFKGNKGNVKAMERILLTAIPSCENINEEYVSKDGYSEIRPICEFDKCLGIINTNQEYINLKKDKIKIEDKPKTVKEAWNKEIKNRKLLSKIDKINKIISDNLLGLSVFTQEFGELALITEEVEICEYYGKEILKFHINKPIKLNWDDLRQNIHLSNERVSTARGYGVETAEGRYDENRNQITSFVIIHLPDMKLYDLHEYNEYCRVFERQYERIRKYAYSLVGAEQRILVRID